jgi:hypothetical protein
MLTTSASDAEHNSDDHDVKDLSFRSGAIPQSALAVDNITSNMHHMDTSDYDSTRSPTTSTGTTSTTSTKITTASISTHLNNLSPPHIQENVSRTVRIRKLSENSQTDVEHCSNSYKFKNYIQQRFTHETYHSEESMQSNQCLTEHDSKNEHHENNSNKKNAPITISEINKMNGVHQDCKNEVQTTNSTSPVHNLQQQQLQQQLQHKRNEKNSNDTLNGNSNTLLISHHSIPIPIFACHSQGFYVPLNVDYDLLIPFLGGIDLLNKSHSHLPPLHPVNINVNYASTLIKNALTTNFLKPKVENGIMNGW